MFGTLNQRWLFLLQQRDGMLPMGRAELHQNRHWAETLLKWCREKLTYYAR
jgi:hypothetical protein